MGIAAAFTVKVAARSQSRAAPTVRWIGLVMS